MVCHKIIRLRRFVLTRLGIEVDHQKSARLRKVWDIIISRTGVDLNQIKVWRMGTCLAVALPSPSAGSTVGGCNIDGWRRWKCFLAFLENNCHPLKWQPLQRYPTSCGRENRERGESASRWPLGAKEHPSREVIRTGILLCFLLPPLFGLFLVCQLCWSAPFSPLLSFYLSTLLECTVRSSAVI